MLAPALRYHCISFAESGEVHIDAEHLDLLDEWDVEQLRVDTTTGYRNARGHFYDQLERVARQQKRPRVIVTCGAPIAALPGYRLIRRERHEEGVEPYFTTCVFDRFATPAPTSRSSFQMPEN